jgi:glutamate--cysteine ligase
MLEIASEGLRRIGHGQGDQEDERGFLDPVREVIEAGRSPGQEILERWEGDWGHSVERLIEYSRY